MYGYIYKTTNLINGKIYIGKKVSSKFLGNRYLGSGKLLRQAVNKYGVNNFEVIILDIAENKEELCKKEQHWIEELHCLDKSIGYNLALGGEGGDTTSNRSPEDNKKSRLKAKETLINKYGTSKPSRGKITINDGNKNKMIWPSELDNFLQRGWILGGKSLDLSEEERIRRSDSNKNKKGKPNGLKGRKLIYHPITLIVRRVYPDDISKFLSEGWMLGRPKGYEFTEEHKQHLRDAHKGQKGHSKNKICINDGEKMIYIEKSDLDQYLNLGWKRGRLPISEEHRANLSKALKGKEISWAKGTHYYTNGLEEKRIFESEVEYYTSLGWWKGRLN